MKRISRLQRGSPKYLRSLWPVRLTNGFGDERVALECKSWPRDRKLQTRSRSHLKTLMAYFALCVPVKSANEGFNKCASCKVRFSVGYAYEAAECAKVVPRAKSSMRGETKWYLKVCCRIAVDTALKISCRRLP